MPKIYQDIKTQFGFNFRTKVEQESAFYKELTMTGAYEKGTCHVMTILLKEGDAFVDIGAHFGFLTTLASQLVGQSGVVYSYEPNPEAFEILEHNQSCNCIRNVRVERCAISTAVGNLRLYDVSKKGIAGSMSLMQPKYKCDSVEIVCQTPFSCSMKQLLERSNDVSIIKIDVEGFEDKVLDSLIPFLKNLRQKLYPVIICEMSGNRQWRDNLFDRLLDIHNFMMFRLERNKGWVGKLITATKSNINEHDNIFCFPAERFDSAPAELF